MRPNTKSALKIVGLTLGVVLAIVVALNWNTFMVGGLFKLQYGDVSVTGLPQELPAGNIRLTLPTIFFNVGVFANYAYVTADDRIFLEDGTDVTTQFWVCVSTRQSGFREVHYRLPQGCPNYDDGTFRQ